jgi:hypothetical protein
MQTSFAEDSACVQKKSCMTRRQSENVEMLSSKGDFCDGAFVTELCILSGCKNIGVRPVAAQQTGGTAREKVASARGVTPQEKASLAGIWTERTE